MADKSVQAKYRQEIQQVCCFYVFTMPDMSFFSILKQSGATLFVCVAMLL